MTTDLPILKVGDECPHCIKHKFDTIGTICLVEEDFPWTIDHLQCDYCDSTYILEDEE